MIPPRHRRSRRPLTAPARTAMLLLTVSLGTAVLAGCSASPEAAATPTGSVAASPSATLEASATPDAEPAGTADPTCETIISADVVADFESVGWSVEPQPFYLADQELDGGLQCVWADFEGPAGDHLQLFGWAPIDAASAADAQEFLVDQGWVREDSAAGVYITENPDTTIAVDEDGYGMTYLFVDGSVTLADTKQGLLLIEWP